MLHIRLYCMRGCRPLLKANGVSEQKHLFRQRSRSGAGPWPRPRRRWRSGPISRRTVGRRAACLPRRRIWTRTASRAATTTAAVVFAHSNVRHFALKVNTKLSLYLRLGNKTSLHSERSDNTFIHSIKLLPYFAAYYAMAL